MTTAYEIRRMVLASPVRTLLLAVLLLTIVLWLLSPPQYPPNDDVFQPDRRVDGFVLEIADPDSLIEYEFSHGPLEPLGLIARSGFRWITFEGRTYQGHFADLGMFHRDEYSPMNAIVVRQEIGRNQHSKWPYSREVTITDSSTGQPLGRAERWYGKNWKKHPDQERQMLSKFIAKFREEQPKTPFTIVPMTVTATDIDGGIPTGLEFDSRPPEIDNCGDEVELVEYGHRFGIKTATWAYYSLGWMEYVYCRGDQIFVVLGARMPSTNVFDLVWLDVAGSVRGRFRHNLSGRETLRRAPYWIESLEYSAGKITIDRRSAFKCRSGSTKEKHGENCRTKSALIEIETASENGPAPFVTELIAKLIRGLH